jgi:epoxyqueuosine reductase
MLADSYAPRRDPRDALAQGGRAAVSVYAQGRDYHDSVKPRLKRLLRWLLAQASGHEGKVFVDTAPVMEKPLAQAAGLGWQGKHTNLLGRGFGNWVFLGAILTTVALPPDAPERDHCGSCRACLDACPTAAFPAPYRLDARRCLSYLTIEHRGPIPEEFRAAMGNRVFGCDDCLAACPWNKFAVAASELRYLSDAEAPPLAELAALDDAAFRARFAGTPVRRIGRDRFLRNVLYAIGNSADPSLLPAAAAHRGAEDPAVADAAAWAVPRLRERAATGRGGPDA